MGIPHYFYIITKNYPGVIHTTKPTSCNHYFLDFNGLIHHASRKCKCFIIDPAVDQMQLPNHFIQIKAPATEGVKHVLEQIKKGD